MTTDIKNIILNTFTPEKWSRFERFVRHMASCCNESAEALSDRDLEGAFVAFGKIHNEELVLILRDFAILGKKLGINLDELFKVLAVQAKTNINTILN